MTRVELLSKHYLIVLQYQTYALSQGITLIGTLVQHMSKTIPLSTSANATPLHEPTRNAAQCDRQT